MEDLLKSLKDITPDGLQSCCTKFYENDLSKLILGENFHPGGEKLTVHLGEILKLNKDSIILDVACGTGISAVKIAKYFGCKTVGIDLSDKNLERAKARAERTGLDDRVTFEKTDAKKSIFKNKSFDAVICECALSTFPDIKAALTEMFRVLKNGGRVGITDITIEREIPKDFKNIISHITFIDGAKSKNEYKKLLRECGFRNIKFEDHNYVITEIFKKIEKAIKGWKIIDGILNTDIKNKYGLTPAKANEYLNQGYSELENGSFAYGLFIGNK